MERSIDSQSGLLTKCVHAPVHHCRHNKNGFILQQKQTQTPKKKELLKSLWCFWCSKSKTTKWVTSIHLNLWYKTDFGFYIQKHGWNSHCLDFIFCFEGLTIPERACPWNTCWSSAWRALLDYWVGCYEGLLAHHCYQSLKTPSTQLAHWHEYMDIKFL